MTFYLVQPRFTVLLCVIYYFSCLCSIQNFSLKAKEKIQLQFFIYSFIQPSAVAVASQKKHSLEFFLCVFMCVCVCEGQMNQIMLTEFQVEEKSLFIGQAQPFIMDAQYTTTRLLIPCLNGMTKAVFTLSFLSTTICYSMVP